MREHSLFLTARILYQDLPDHEKWTKISQYIQTRAPEEVELHNNIYEFHFLNPARVAFASNAITDFYEFTTTNWSPMEQSILDREYERMEHGQAQFVFFLLPH